MFECIFDLVDSKVLCLGPLQFFFFLIVIFMRPPGLTESGSQGEVTLLVQAVPLIPWCGPIPFFTWFFPRIIFSGSFLLNDITVTKLFLFNHNNFLTNKIYERKNKKLLSLGPKPHMKT